MNSRELVYATLNFTDPERLPTDFWPLPSTWFDRKEAVDALLSRFPVDIVNIGGNPVFDIPFYTKGTYTDLWGCEWLLLQDGIVGEVKRAPLADYANLAGYQWPTAMVEQGWDDVKTAIAAKHEQFILGWSGDGFERMQFLRGPEQLYEDLADEDCAEVYELRDKVFGLIRRYTEHWAQTDVDAIFLSDDWGSQRSLLISPKKWREFFKPKYKECFDIALNAGKKIFFHSDGYILDIYPDFIEMGLSAINSQIWCMGLDNLQQYAGKITFWGELDRQEMLPHGTPDQIRAAGRQMGAQLYKNGGLIGQSSVDNLSSLENIEAALSIWREVALK